MLGNLKKILGIEGLKVNVHIPETVRKDEGILRGTIKLTTFRDTKLSDISIKVIERYSRGRGNNRLVNEYVMGQVQINKSMTIQKDEEKLVDFELPMHIVQSEMDKWEEQNFFFKGLVKLAKTAKGVKSEYFVLVEAREVGATLSPHVKKSFLLV